MPGLMSLAADQASARFDRLERRLTLARDAFGMKPLAWARAGRRVAFASEPAVVAALLGIRLEIDDGVVTQFLARREVADDRTAFAGIRVLEAGHWLTVDESGRVGDGVWFRPEDLISREMSDEEAVEEVSSSVAEAVASRVVRGRTGLLLSSGRDSSSIAVALSRLGERVTCATQEFDADLDVNEGADAEESARSCGHAWLTAPVPSNPPADAYAEIPKWAGTPCGYLGFPQATAPMQILADARVRVVLNGEGGEPLFSASPVVVLDLLRAGRAREALVAARTFDAEWTYPFPVTVKAAIRAMLPTGVLRFRERLRPVPPWLKRSVQRPLDPVTAPRSESRSLLTSIRPAGGTAYDLDERLGAIHGLEIASPLLDLRVVRVAMNMRPTSRAPVPEPKPILARAFLRGLPGERRKVSFYEYYLRLAHAAWKTVPEVFGPGSRLARRGLVDGSIVQDHRGDWPIESLALVPVEMWLRADELEG